MPTIGWMGLVAAVLVGVPAVPSAQEEAGGEEAAPPPPAEHLPEDVRAEMVPFSGELEAIDDALAETLLGRLCPEDLVRAGEGESGEWTCPVCPDFSSRAGEPENWRLTRVLRGDFFEKDRDEIFAVWRGCEGEHAAGGGAVMFRKRKGKWVAFYRHPGLHPQQCVALRADDHRDRLACRVRTRAESGKIVERVVGTRGNGQMRELAKSVDNSGTCPKNRFVSSYLAGWELREDGEGPAELTIEKIQRWRELEEGNDREVCALREAGGEWSRHRRIEMSYEFDGESLRRRDVQTEEISSKLESAERDEQATR